MAVEKTSDSLATSMLLRQVLSLSAMRVIVNSAFNAGSSKHGNARRAPIGSMCELARYLVAPLESSNLHR